MPTSTSDIYVWAWLPGAGEPIFAGALRAFDGAGLSFAYGRDYLALENPPSLLFAPKINNVALPRTWYEPTHNLGLPATLRDASPDSWGRRVIINQVFGSAAEGNTGLLTERDYLLRSGSNRLGNLDFQTSQTAYEPRVENATLDQLYNAAQLVDEGVPLPENLAQALLHGTAIGGARPKALLQQDGREYIAKFSTAEEIDVVGAEAASIYLASRAGIAVPAAHVARSMGRKALVMERFDRPGDGKRTGVVSGLTILGGPETGTVYGSYPELLDELAVHAKDASGLRDQMFRRVAFNIAISNTDDHLRNHAAFWDGTHLELTPAYDLSPVERSGEEANQALPYGRDGERRSNLSTLIGRASDYGLSQPGASSLVEEVTAAIRDNWEDAADFAELTKVDRTVFWGRLFLNRGVLHDLRGVPVFLPQRPRRF